MVGSSYDAIVIGAGHNGLTCAGYLAKSGLSVVVFEKQMEPGGGLHTLEVSATGHLHNVHSNFHAFNPWAPAFVDLNLGKYGDEIEITFTDLVFPPDAEKVMRDYISLGYKFLIVDGFFVEDVTNLAPQFPDVNFLLVGILELDVADNVSGIHYLTSEGGYLQGIIAGMMTQNNKIGFIGGIDIPDIIAIYNAMILGAMSVNPNLEIDDFSDVYLGTFADPALAKEAALTLNDAGADVIFSSCDLGVIGVAEAATERGFYVLVAGTPEVNDLAPELVLSADPSFVHYDTKYWETEYLKQKAGIFGNQKFAVGLSTGHASFEDVLFIFDSLPSEIATSVQGIGNDIKDHIIYIPLLTQKGGAEQYLAENGLPPYEFP